MMNKEFEMTDVDLEWLNKAIGLIMSGEFTRLEYQNLVIYKCGTIIRMDIKVGK